MPPGKDNAGGLSPEINRLTALLVRDPKSKLFIPLAEEYMKAGMVEEAVMALDEGLKANPFYTSARVLLGKALLEKGDPDKAREQFELVVKTVPDNLLAHRKLGEIYNVQGKRAEAIRSFRMVTILSPKDEEAKRLLAELESGALPEAAEAAAQPAQAMQVESHRAAPEAPVSRPSYEEAPQAQAPVFDVSEAEEPELVEEAEEILEQPEMSAPEEAAVLDMPVIEMETIDHLRQASNAEPADTVISTPLKGYAVDLGAKAGLEDIFSAYKDVLPEDGPPAGDNGSVYEIEEDLSSFEIEGVKFEPQAPKAGPAKIPAPMPEPEEPEPAQTRDVFETPTLAELYIAQGFYDRAIGIYKNMLLDDPDNKAVRQKLEELYALAQISSGKAAAMPEREAVTQEYEPPSFELPEGEMDALETVPYEEAPEGLVAAWETPPAKKTEPLFDSGAVRRLEQFLENIRRKGAR